VWTVITAGGAVTVSLGPSAVARLTSAGAIAGGRAPEPFFPGALILVDYFDKPRPLGAMSSAARIRGAFDPPVPIGQVDD
jgi:hypothetical protein